MDARKDPRLYGIWKHMRRRCLRPGNPRYADYGGRGITICDHWLGSFVAFQEWALRSGYAPDLTIERVDVDGHYSPENCRWVTRGEQNRNTRRIRWVTMLGETKPLVDWSRDDRCVVSSPTFKRRVSTLGWHPEDAMLTPLRQMPEAVARGRLAIPAAMPVSEDEAEVWKPIPEWEGYEVSTFGRVRSYRYVVREGLPRDAPKPTVIVPEPRLLKLTLDRRCGRQMVSLHRGDGKPQTRMVHRLVLLAHVGPCPPGMEACHFPDPDQANNRLSNLRWGSHSENLRDKTRTNRLARSLE